MLYKNHKLIFILMIIFLINGGVAIADTESKEKNSDNKKENMNVAFPERYMIRVGSYFIDRATTDLTILSNAGIGGGISFSDDLGGEESDVIPRIDAYFRFNKKHRIDFTAFSVNRPGSKTLSVDLEIGDEVYNASETLNSEIKYTLYKLGYAYSFYHSSKVELSLLFGFSLTSYDINYSVDNGGKAAASDVTAPLPTFGLRMGYAITPKLSIHYSSESFFIEIEDAIKGAFLNYELNLEYRLFKHFALGGGITRSSSDIKITTSGWDGSIKDSRRGFLLYGAFYF